MKKLSVADQLEREQRKAAREKLEATLALALRAHGIRFERQHRFDDARQWRFDFALLEHRLAIEVQGGIWSAGRHSRGSGITKECEKFAAAAILGWRVMPVTGDQVEKGEAVHWVLAAMAWRNLE